MESPRAGVFRVDLLGKEYKLKLMKEDKNRIRERAEQLVDSHASLMQQLIALRKDRNLSQELVGKRMGISQPAVAAFEGHESNPTLSSIRRYALAVGATIEHTVRDDRAIIASAVSGQNLIEDWLSQAPQEVSGFNFTATAQHTSNVD